MATLIEQIKAWRRRKFIQKCSCASHDALTCNSWIRNKPKDKADPCNCICHREDNNG